MTAADLPGAIEALRITAAYDAHDETIVDSYGEVPLTFGQARVILEALSGPYVPGMARVTGEEYAKVANDVPGGRLHLHDPTSMKPGTHVYFTAVTE